MLQSLIPVVMAGIIAVYSLVISVLIAGDVKPPPNRYSLFECVRSISCLISPLYMLRKFLVVSCILELVCPWD